MGSAKLDTGLGATRARLNIGLGAPGETGLCKEAAGRAGDRDVETTEAAGEACTLLPLPTLVLCWLTQLRLVTSRSGLGGGLPA